MKLASEAMWAMPPEVADDYDIWITVGQSLHQLDESLLAEWDEWSKQSSKYREGECQRRWNSFSREGGRGLGSLIHVAQQHGFRFFRRLQVFYQLTIKPWNTLHKFFKNLKRI